MKNLIKNLSLIALMAVSINSFAMNPFDFTPIDAESIVRYEPIRYSNPQECYSDFLSPIPSGGVPSEITGAFVVCSTVLRGKGPVDLSDVEMVVIKDLQSNRFHIQVRRMGTGFMGFMKLSEGTPFIKLPTNVTHVSLDLINAEFKRIIERINAQFSESSVGLCEFLFGRCFAKKRSSSAVESLLAKKKASSKTKRASRKGISKKSQQEGLICCKKKPLSDIIVGETEFPEQKITLNVVKHVEDNRFYVQIFYCKAPFSQKMFPAPIVELPPFLGGEECRLPCTVGGPCLNKINTVFRRLVFSMDKNTRWMCEKLREREQEGFDEPIEIKVDLSRTF